MSTHTTVNTTKETRGGGAMVFILGGVVVAVLAIGYFLFSNGTFGVAGAPSGGGDVSISVETGGADGGQAATPGVAPAAPAVPEATTPAPAN